MAHLRLIFITILVFIIHIESKISNERLCADPKCSTPVSIAKTMIRYLSDDKNILSFPKGIELKVFSKSAGSRTDLWGVEIKGNRGYVPKGFIQETKLLVKHKLVHIVPTEEIESVLDTEYHSITADKLPDYDSDIKRRKEAKLSDEQESSFNPVSSISDGTELGAGVTVAPGYVTPSFLSGAAADSVQKVMPSPEDVRQPFEVVAGTTVYLDTGGGSEDKPIQATTTNTNIQPSTTVEQRLKSDIDEDSSDNKLEKPNESMGLPKSATSGGGDIKNSKDDQDDKATESLINTVLNQIEGSAGEMLNYLKGSISGAEETKDKVETDGDNTHSTYEELEEEDNYEENDDSEDGGEDDDEEEEEEGENDESLEENADLKVLETSQTQHAPETEGGGLQNPITMQTAEVNKVAYLQQETLKNTKPPVVEADSVQKVGVHVNSPLTEPLVVNGKVPDLHSVSSQCESVQCTESPPVETGSVQKVNVPIHTHLTEPFVVSDVVNVRGENSNIQSVPSQQPDSLQDNPPPPVEAASVQKDDTHVNIHEVKPVVVSGAIDANRADSVHQSGDSKGLEEIEKNEPLPQIPGNVSQYITDKDDSLKNDINISVPDKVKTELPHYTYIPNMEKKDVDKPLEKVDRTPDASVGVESSASVSGRNVEVVMAQGSTSGEMEQASLESGEDSDMNTSLKNDINISVPEKVNSELPHYTYIPNMEKKDVDKPLEKVDRTPDASVGLGSSASVSGRNVEVIMTQDSTSEEMEQANLASGEDSDMNASFFESSLENMSEDSLEETILQVQPEVDQNEVPIKHPIVDQQKDDNIVFVREQTELDEPTFSSPEVSTGASIDWVEESLSLTHEEPVTEGYTNIDEQTTKTEDDTEEDSSLEDVETEESSGEMHESEIDSTELTGQLPGSEVLESSEGFFSGLGSSLSSLWGSSENVAEELSAPAVEEQQHEEAVKESLPRKREVRDAAWSSLPLAPTEKKVDEDYQEGDHLISNIASDMASCGALSGVCEVKSASGVHPTEEQQLPAALGPEQQILDKAIAGSNVAMELQKAPFESVIFLVITAVTVLLFTLGYYYIEKLRRDGSLVAKITSLEKALLVSSKENFTLKDDLKETKDKLVSFEDSSLNSGEVVEVLRSELEDSKVTKAKLEEQVASLEKELEDATEAGLELNRMLSEFLSAQHGSDTLMKSIEQLQNQLDSQKGTISTMNSSLSAKNMENENLQADMINANEQILALEQDLQKVNQSVIDLQINKQEMEQELMSKTRKVETQLVEALESKSAESQRLCRELDSLQESLDETRRTLATRNGEMAVLQDCLKQSNASEGKMKELLDVGRVRAELTLATQERDGLMERLQGEEDARKLLEDHVKIVSEEVASMRLKYDEAERDKVEAQTRLEVLSNYFKEKETQLQKELGLQEAMCIQKEGDATSTYERIKSLQDEIENYKSQNETLKKEILDQERGLRAHIATLEKKVHENWVVARQAERRLEESKQESGQLRNRLTLVERNLANSSQSSDPSKLNDRLTVDSNGELPTSPLHMGLADLQSDSPASPLHYGHPVSPPLLPPTSGQPPLPPGPFPGMPPGMFMPPPPGLPFMPPPIPLPPRDRRPPPLGRMSSPPPEPRGGGFSPYDRSPPRSPPGRPYRSPRPHYDDSPERFRQRSPPPSNSHPFGMYPPHPGGWDDRNGPPRSSFRPLRRDSPRESKGSNLSSGHSSESLEKSSRHSGRV